MIKYEFLSSSGNSPGLGPALWPHPLFFIAPPATLLADPSSLPSPHLTSPALQSREIFQNYLSAAGLGLAGLQGWLRGDARSLLSFPALLWLREHNVIQAIIPYSSLCDLSRLGFVQDFWVRLLESLARSRRVQVLSTAWASSSSSGEALRVPWGPADGHSTPGPAAALWNRCHWAPSQHQSYTAPRWTAPRSTEGLLSPQTPVKTNLPKPGSPPADPNPPWSTRRDCTVQSCDPDPTSVTAAASGMRQKNSGLLITALQGPKHVLALPSLHPFTWQGHPILWKKVGWEMSVLRHQYPQYYSQAQIGFTSLHSQWIDPNSAVFIVHLSFH